MKNNTRTYKHEKGQTLLFVIVAVTIAMAIGVAVSTRTISSLKRVARTDTSARVIAAAEGGIENLLSRPYSALESARQDNPAGTDCGDIGATTPVPPEAGKCAYLLSIPKPSSEDQISSRAIVSVNIFNSNTQDGGYSFTLEPGSVKEIHLSTTETYTPNDIQICWKSQNTAIYYYSYNSSGEVLKGGIYPSSGFSHSSDVSDIFEQSNSNRAEYLYCSAVNLVSNPYGLRIKVLYNQSEVAVFPTSGNLPSQGYELTSRGEISTEIGSEEKATVIVHKSYPYAPDIFDYGIYTPNTLSGSN